MNPTQHNLNHEADYQRGVKYGVDMAAEGVRHIVEDLWMAGKGVTEDTQAIIAGRIILRLLKELRQALDSELVAGKRE